MTTSRQVSLAALALGVIIRSSGATPMTSVQDEDERKDRRSQLWESAQDPHRFPFEALLAEAQQSLEDRTPEGARDAIAKLDRALALIPDGVAARRMRGDAHLVLRDWERCAADFAPYGDAKVPTDVRRKLGICQARAGKLSDAERTLAEAVATAATGALGELWLRLGEVRVAMGKLDEAISALEVALAHPTEVSPALVRFVLAGAHDRARNPAVTSDLATRALAVDRDLATLRIPAIPLLGAGEAEYLMGVAYGYYEPARPEFSLAAFRRFVALAPTSPWRRRAEDHIRQLRAVAMPEYVDKRGGTAPLDVVQARSTVRGLIAPARACMARTPGVVLDVLITKTGRRSTTPASPPPPRTAVGTRPPTAPFVPPQGTTILPALNLDDTSKADIDAAVRCVEPIAARILAALPPIKDNDAYYRAQFSLVAP